MTETTFLPPARLASYPLHLREPQRQDHERLSALARELGYEPSSAIVSLAIAELQRYREAMHGFRNVLVAQGQLAPLPVRNDEPIAWAI
jgi:hypothetical protein